MAATQLLQIHLTHGFDMSPGFVTVPIVAGKSGGEEKTDVKFYKLSDLLKAPSESGKKISDKFRIAVVQAILFSLQRSKSCEGATEGNIYISKDRSTVNVPRPIGAGSSSLKCLSENFKHIFAGKMLSPDIQTIADDFCERIAKGHLPVESALKHPIFWTASQKIRYFKKSQNAEKRKSSDRTSQSMIGGTWVDKLLINDSEELENLRVVLRSKEASLSVEDDTIKNLVVEETRRSYDATSWTHFLDFFRNIHAHFWQHDENVLCCFRNDEHDGYWDFFSKRFPGLFIKVYKEYQHKTSFHIGVEPKFLPDIFEEEGYIATVKTNTRVDVGAWAKRKIRRSRQGV